MADATEIAELIDAVRSVHVADQVRSYAVDLVDAPPAARPELRLGASPRATLQLMRAARAAAALDGRDYVLPDDVQELAGAGARPPAAAHRRGADRPPRRPTDVVADIVRPVAGARRHAAPRRATAL